MKKSFKKRLLSGVTSALLAVSSVLPSSLGTFAATNENGGTRNDVTLLVGTNPKKPDGMPYQQQFASVKDAIAQYNKDYALGIASQFCVFLKGDFNPNDSDAEGRVAIGGNFLKTGNVYEIGNGDFTSRIYLGGLIDNSNYATIICSGDSISGLSGGAWSRYVDENGKDIHPRTTIWKNTDTTVKIDDFGPFNRDKEIILDNVWSSPDSDLDVAKWFDEIIVPRSKTLSEKKTNATEISINTKATEKIPYFNQYSYDNVNGKFTEMEVHGVTHFEYTGSSNASTVYFEVSESDWKDICQTQVFYFDNIPNGASIVVNVAGKDITINDISNPNGSLDRYTYINNIAVSKGTYTVLDPDEKPVEDASVLNEIEFNNITNNGDPLKTDAEMKKLLEKYFGKGYTITGMYNNYSDVDRLLYNFYQAEKIQYKQAFQGTILAPQAHVTSNQGHLSGALIAESAEGGMEFGYRPYVGPSSVIDVSSNYYINLSKIDGEKSTSENKVPLPGAVLGVYAIDEETGKPNMDQQVAQITSTEDVVELDIPAGTYAVMEVQAPASYVIDPEQIYYIEVGETFLKDKDGKDIVIQTGKYNYTPKEYTQEDAENLTKVENAGNLTDEDLQTFADKGATDEADTTPADGEDTPDTNAAPNKIGNFVKAEEAKYEYTYKYVYELKPAGNINALAWNDNDITAKIKKLTINYEDSTKSPFIQNDVSANGGDWWYPFDIQGANLDGVTSIELVLSSKLNASDRLAVQLKDNKGTITYNVDGKYNDYSTNPATEVKCESPTVSSDKVQVEPAKYYKVDPDSEYEVPALDGKTYKVEYKSRDEIEVPVTCVQTVTFKSSATSKATYEEFKEAKPTTISPLSMTDSSVKYVLGDDEYSFTVENGTITAIMKNDDLLTDNAEFNKFKAYKVADSSYVIAKVDGNDIQVLDAKIILNDNAFEFVNYKQKVDEVQFSKEDTDGLPVSGAQLQLTGVLKDGKTAATFTENQFEFVARETDKKDDETSDEESKEEETPTTPEAPVISITKDGKTVTWTSDEKILTIKNLADGTYTLTETESPENYHKAEPITFVMDGGKLVSINDVKLTDTSDRTIHMVDTLHGSITITKRDGNLRGLAGAELVLTGTGKDGEAVTFTKENIKFNIAEGETNKGGFVEDNKPTTLRWKSSGYSVTLEHLPVGDYTLHEETPPTGYNGTKDIKFKVLDEKDDKGNPLVTFENIDSLDNSSKYDYSTQTSFFSKESSTIYVINTSHVEIEKVDKAGNSLEGATLKLTGVKLDADGKETKEPITFRKSQFSIKDLTEDNLEEIIWKTDGEPVEFLNMQDGRYTLEEVNAPEGYQTAGNIRFTVKGSLIVRINGVPVAPEEIGSVQLITMTDEKSNVTIAKQDETFKPLAGAKLILTGVKKVGEEEAPITLTGVTMSVEGFTPEQIKALKQKESTDTKIVWLSSGQKQIKFEGLPDGTYTLHEEEAPENYEVTNDVKFTIVNGKIDFDNVYRVVDGKDEKIKLNGNTITLIDNKAETTTTSTETETTTSSTQTETTTTQTETTTTQTETTTTQTETTTTQT
ncbi:MAG: choice-of-anchor A family protein, partial [Oscillospiraceae bacterium]|nr:choice-of-anchor A family protein [Oscillospiraceae bacterium]